MDYIITDINIKVRRAQILSFDVPDSVAKLGSEPTNDLPHRFARTNKKIGNRDKRNCSSRDLEGYLDGEFDICIKSRISCAQSDARDFSTVLRDWMKNRRGYPTNLDWFGCASDRYPLAQSCGSDNHQRQTMFLLNVQFVQDRKDIVVSNSVLKGLGFFDKLGCSGGDTLYVPALDGIFKFLGRAADGKLMGIAGLSTSVLYENPYEIVQYSSKMMDYFSGKDGKAKRRRRAPNPHNVISSLILKFLEYVVWSGIRLDISINFTLKILDALISPLKFRKNAIEWSHIIGLGSE